MGFKKELAEFHGPLSANQRANLRRWERALRSGKYLRITKKLRSMDGGFCCLGVMCDLHDRDGWVPDVLAGRFVFGAPGPKTEALFPPARVIASFGVSTEEAHVFAGANDSGKSFEWIADRVREKLDAAKQF